jgi:hypothetical protein
MAQGGRRIVALMLALLALASCRPQPQSQVHFFAEGQPQRLSQWQLLTLQDQRLRLNPGVLPYDLNSPLFSDYALKLRTVWMPQRPGGAIPRKRNLRISGRHHHQQDFLLCLAAGRALGRRSGGPAGAGRRWAAG